MQFDLFRTAFIILIIIAINYVEKHPQLEIKCMSVAVEGNKFLALCRDLHVFYMYPVYMAPLSI